jgi:cytochrome P450
MTSLDAIDFFRDASVIDDPHPYFDRLRSECPVLREPHHGVMMVTGYDEALEILGKQRDAFSSCVAVTGPIPPLPFTPQGDHIADQIQQHRAQMPWTAHLVTLDGIEHSALRAILTRLLTHERLRKHSRAFAQE